MISETLNDAKSVQEQANLWITRLDKGLSSAEKQHLVAWMNQDKAHYNAIQRMSSLWGDIGVQHDLNGLFDSKSAKKSHTDYLMKFSLAASIMFVALLSASLFTDVNQLWKLTLSPAADTPQYQKFRTHYGQQKTFTLADNTIMVLNTNTIIEVAYSEKQRKINLIRGEANFDVAKDKTRPFTVVSGEQSFTALGTIFNVQRQSTDNIELVVNEGRVLISDTNTSVTKLLNIMHTPQAELSDDITVIKESEKAVITDAIVQPTIQLAKESVQKELAWKKGMLIFNGESLSNVLIEIERYNDVKFSGVNQNMAHLKVAGYFKTQDISGLLQSLDYNFGITSTRLINNEFQLSLNMARQKTDELH
jgi:transmembrane sensor